MGAISSSPPARVLVVANEAVCRMFLESPPPPRKRPWAARKTLPEARNHRYESVTNDAGHAGHRLC